MTIKTDPTSEAARRAAFGQALANTAIEGHEPSPAFLRDCEAVAQGRMTHDQMVKASLARAQRAEVVLKPAANEPIQAASRGAARARGF